GGAKITVGHKALPDADAAGGSMWVGATDTAYVITVAGTVATSEQSGIGASLTLNTVLRDTEALIGNRLGSTTTDSSGSLTSGGGVTVTAANHGFVGSFAIAGAKATNEPAGQQPAAVEEPRSSTANGTGGTQGTNGTTAGNDALNQWQS